MVFKKTYILISFLLSVVLMGFLLPLTNTIAQSAPTINYQGKLADASGVAVADGSYNMRFWLTQSQGQATTSAVWTESLTGAAQVQVTNGLFSVMLGSTSPLTSVDFNQVLYLGVEIGGAGVVAWDGEMSPRKELGTVPAAFESYKLGGVASTSFLRSDQDDTASGLLTFTGGLVSSASSTIVSLTTETSTTTNFVINNELFTDLAGTGLANVSGVLTVATTTLGLGDGTFLGLSDTPGSYTTNLIPYMTGSALTTDSNFAYNGTNLVLGGTTGVSLGGDVLLSRGAADRLDLATGDSLNLVSGSLQLFGVDYLTGDNTTKSVTLGELAGATFTTGNNVAIGHQAGRYASTTAYSSTYIGYKAGYDNTGFWVAAIGEDAAGENTGDNVNAIGAGAAYANRGLYVNAFGRDAASANTGSYVNAFGYQAGVSNTGNYNEFIGHQAARDLQSTSTVAIGAQALFGPGSTYSSLNNTAIGYRAGYVSANGSGNNILLGYQAADNLTTGHNNIIIGYDIDNVTAASNNVLNIGNLIFGTGLDGTGTTLASGNIGIGTSSPSAKLTVAGDAYIGGNLRATGTVQFDALTSGLLLADASGNLSAVATSSLGFTAGATTFLGLSDTPGSYTANRIPYMTGSALTSSANFTYNGTNLNLGTGQGLSIGGTRYFTADTTNDSISIGEGAGATFNSTTQYNTALGFQAAGNVSGTNLDYSNYIGYQAGYNAAYIYGNYIGYQAGYNASTSAASQILIGTTAGYNNSGSRVVGIGEYVGHDNTGEYMNMFGSSAGYANTGSYSNLLGEYSGYNNTGSHVSIVGRYAGYNNTGSDNNIFGQFAGYSNTGSNNNFFGQHAGYSNTGDYNEMIGFQTGKYLKSTKSVAIGGLALYGGSSYTSNNNVAVGYRAGYSARNTSGNNILLGYQAADNLTTGHNNIIIGYDIDNVTAASNNVLNIGNLIFGTGLDGTGTTLASGNIGIGTSSPSAKLTVAGDAYIGGNLRATGTITFGTLTSGLLQADALGVLSSVATSTLGFAENPFGATINVTELASEDFGSFTCSGAICSLDSNSISASMIANGDHGFFSYSGNVASLDANGLSSANLISAVSDEVGTGYLVFNDAPTFTTSITTPLILGGTGTTQDLTFQTTSGAGTTGADMHFLVGNNGATEALTILNDGTVGIGTTTPLYLLSLGQQADSSGLRINGYQDESDEYIDLSIMNNGFSRFQFSTQLHFYRETNQVFGFSGTGAVFDTGSVGYDFDFTDTAFIDGGLHRVGIGTTSPSSKLSLQNLAFSGAGVVGLDQYLSTANSVSSAVQYGNRFYLDAANTATTTIVGSIYRIKDNTTYGNTVRGLEVQTNRGTNTLGENTALSGFARTFGVRGVTSGDAGDTYEPAGGFFETEGTTQGNAIRGYSDSITTASLLSLFQASSTFAGTGLQMNFGNTGGSFSSTTSKYLDFQNAGTSVFTVSGYGTTTIGDGTQTHLAGLQIGYGGLCVDTDGTCTAGVAGRIASVSTYAGNSDLAEMYFSTQSLLPGELVASDGFISISRASQSSAKKIIGVVSTKPGLLLGADDTSLVAGQHGYPLALSGRVPVRLSNENGNIQAGDPLTLSSLPGIAMKATEADEIVGYALESFSGVRAYTEGFINQFGDDISEPNYEAININTKAKLKASCYFGAGAQTGEEVECDPDDVSVVDDTTEQDIAAARFEAEQVALQALRTVPAESYTLSGGRKVKVGQVTMFVDRGYHFKSEQIAVLNELTSTSTELVSGAAKNSGETLWGRMKDLAQHFVDGVLTLTGLKADKVTTSELCVDDVCVTASDLRALLESANNDGQVVDVQSPTPSPAPVNDPTPTEPPPTSTEDTATTTDSVDESETISATSTPTIPVVEVATTTEPIVEEVVAPEVVDEVIEPPPEPVIEPEPEEPVEAEVIEEPVIEVTLPDLPAQDPVI